MKNYFLILLLLMLWAHEAMGDYEILVTFQSYSNPSGRCAECPGSTSQVPACCDVTSFVPLNQSCPVNEACNTALSGCFRGVGSTGTSCFEIDFQGNVVVSARNFTFGNSSFGFPNPSQVTGEGPWQGTQIFLILRALSQDGSDVIDRIPLDIPMDVLGTPISETTFSGIANIAHLTASMEVRCDDNFYGPNCFTPCSNFVNCAGCGLSGYTGQFCHNDIDDCVGRDCNEGECVDEVNFFRCECNSGFTGQLCTTNIDDCDGINCMNGECVDEVNGFRCECRPGFTGDLCEAINDCVGVDCNNNGQCIDETDNFRCECNLGFSGNLCQTNINDCLRINCNNGICIDEINSYRCECQNGFSGDRCEVNINECEGAECNNGECVDEVNGFRCECSLGFTGERCDTNIDDCTDANCNSGDCRDEINNFTCVCNLGFTGELCETNIDDCEEGVDCNNGTCVDEIQAFTCECDPGFTGELCTVDINHCEGINCNNGTCIDGVTEFTCECDAGFTGDFCQDLVITGDTIPIVESVVGVLVGALLVVIIIIVIAIVIVRSKTRGKHTFTGIQENSIAEPVKIAQSHTRTSFSELGAESVSMVNNEAYGTSASTRVARMIQSTEQEPEYADPTEIKATVNGITMVANPGTGNRMESRTTTDEKIKMTQNLVYGVGITEQNKGLCDVDSSVEMIQNSAYGDLTITRKIPNTQNATVEEITDYDYITGFQ